MVANEPGTTALTLNVMENIFKFSFLIEAQDDVEMFV